MNPDLLSALVAESEHAPLAVVDFLVEYEVPLVDVLLAYCGGPPDWRGGLPQEVLAEWLARQTPADGRAEQLYLAMVFPNAHVDTGIWPFGAHVPFDGGGLEYGQVRQQYTGWRTEDAARRYLKRRVLSLFPEVTHTFESEPLVATPAMAEIGRLFSEVFPWARPDLDPPNRPTPREPRRCPIWWDNKRGVYTQTLPAPEWVPPHDEERARGLGRQMYEATGWYVANVAAGETAARQERGLVEALGRNARDVADAGD